MDIKKIAEEFDKEMFRLSCWDFSPAAVKMQGVYLRAAADKFIFKDLPKEDFNAMIMDAVVHTPFLPPYLATALNFESVQHLAVKLLEICKTCNTLAELELAVNKKSAI